MSEPRCGSASGPAAPGGGFLLAPTHNLQLDVPAANIQAFYDAVRDYGEYPLRV